MSKHFKTTFIQVLTASISIVLLSSLLSGCGFQSRGETLIPRELGPIYVGGISTYGEIAHEIRNELKMADIPLAKTASEARYKIVLLNSASTDRVLSLTSSARAAQYMLLETATIEIRNTENKLLMGPETLSERRVLNYNSDTPQNSSQEQKLLRVEMQKSLARKIARQLTVVSNDKPAAAP
jgi:LPS-assembly lipoprotein